MIIEAILTVFGVGLILAGIRVIYEYEEGIVFTLGKYSGMKQAGLRFIIPVIQTMAVVDKRIRTVDIADQEAITKDNVSVTVNGVVYYQVTDVKKAIVGVEDYEFAVSNYTQATIRDILGNRSLDEILQEREDIAKDVKKALEDVSTKWGIEITNIKLQDIGLPENMKRAMAKEAEAEREKRAVIISAEGELEASAKLSQAAEKMASSPNTIKLRTLQTMREISAQPSQKLVIFMPDSDVEIQPKRRKN